MVKEKAVVDCIGLDLSGSEQHPWKDCSATETSVWFP